MDKIPARIQQMVRAENLQFMKHRDVYDAAYFHFILELATINMVSTVHKRGYDQYYQKSWDG